MIVSTTLLGRGTAPVVRAAIRSVVMLVDACLVIDTGADPADVEEARLAAGSKLVLRTWSCPAPHFDFAAARNAALELAAELGATWALTLDADERIACPDSGALRRELAATTADTLQAFTGTAYAKPRLIRLPCPGRWRGPNHEGLYGVRLATTHALTFWEAPRAPGHLDTKWRRNLATLIPFSAERPDEARWHFYLGEAHRALGEHEKAVARYRACASLRGWDEEGGWACYRGASLLCFELGRHEEALELCALGMTRHPGMPELPWIAGIACYRLGRFAHALYWAKLARVHGLDATGPARALDGRIGFREPRALREGPAELELRALSWLGV